MTIPLLNDVVIMLASGFGTTLLLQKTNIPKIVSYILAGIVIGPSVFNIISNISEIKLIAEIGVILLLFTIGLEFSIERLLSSKKTLFVGGFLQILATIGLVLIASPFLNLSWNAAIFVGFLLAISSTAILLKILNTKNQLNTDFGKRIVGILVFQDLAVIPMILLLPALANEKSNFTDLIMSLGSTIFFLVVGVAIFHFVAKYVFPKILKEGDKESAVISICILCFSLPLFAGLLNISLALGAFLAGLVVSETNYKNVVFNSIEEIKDIFSCIFFISIGLLFNLSHVWNNLLLVVLVVIAVMVINVLASTLALRSVHSWNKSLVSAVCLLQIGEFAFVLSKIGLEKRIINLEQYDMFLAVAIITMIITPFLLDFAQKFENKNLKVLPKELPQ
jgi:monovalent cation:H+ antiporter-2, CPA2 family